MNRRLSRAVVATGLVLAGAGVPVPGAAAPGALSVVESSGVAAVAGVITRVPAESPGGAVFATTAINLDKARGTAAGFTPGNLVEIFFGTSSEDYRNPTLVQSQHPPTGTVPEEATADNGDAGPSGATFLYTTRSTGQPSAESSATARTLVGEGFSATGGRSASASSVAADGSVTTQTRAESTGVVIGDVVTLTNLTSVATAHVGADGTPRAEIRTTVGGVLVNGVPARLTEEGLVLSDRQPLGATELAAFNAGVAELQRQGITLASVPTTVVQEPGRARAAGAVAVARYQIPPGPVPNSIGNDEELLIGQVVAESIAQRTAPASRLPGVGTPGDPGAGLPATPGQGAAAPGSPAPAASPAGVPLPTTGPAPAPGAFSPAPGVFSPGSGAFAPDPGTVFPGNGGASAGSSSLPESAAAGGDTAGPDNAELALFPTAQNTPGERVRAGYGFVILAALTGAGVFAARGRTRLA